jgi:TPR repeat protein
MLNGVLKITQRFIASLGITLEYDQNGKLINSEAKALALYTLAAHLGNAEAQCLVGLYHHEGLFGLIKNDLKAREYLEKSASQGFARAKNWLGIFHNQGLGGLSRDDVLARQFFELAASQGDEYAHHNLGFFYQKGLGGLTQNSYEVRRHFEIAAKKGVSESLYNLGVIYETGWGVERNTKIAFDYFKKAALKNVPQALHKLGLGSLSINPETGVSKKNVFVPITQRSLTYSRQKTQQGTFQVTQSSTESKRKNGLRA